MSRPGKVVSAGCLLLAVAMAPASAARAAGPPAGRPAAGPGYTEGGATGGGLHTAFPGTPLSPAAEAAVERAKTGDPEAIRALLPFFATEDNERLVRFVTTLKGKAVPPLIAALGSTDPATAEAAE